MKSNTTFVELQQVFRDVLGNHELVLSANMSGKDVKGWDSLANLNIIIAIEQRFGFRFISTELSQLAGTGQNVGHLVALVDAKRTL